jgi:hypothetical protein
VNKQDDGFFGRTEDKLMLSSGSILITLLFTHKYGVLPSDAEWVMLGVALTLMALSIWTFIKENC